MRLLAYIPLGGESALAVPGDGGVDIISKDVLAVFRRWWQADGALEACGVLAGRQTDAGALTVDAASEPGPDDERAPHGCQRLDLCHQRLLTAAWEADPSVHFLGSWHTHPEAVPVPSALDVEGWREDAAQVESQLPGGGLRCIHVIVGQDVAGVWEVT